MLRTRVVVLAAAIATTLTAGCATKTSGTPISEPQAVAAEPVTPPPVAAEPATPPPVVAEPATPPRAAKPDAPTTPQPAPGKPAPADKPVASAAPKPAPTTGGKAVPPVATTPAAAARAPKPAAPPVAAPAAPAAPAKLDLNAMKEQLKATKAIGVFTKISLKNQVDDLMQQFRDYYQGKSKLTLADLRQSYNLLMMKVLSLLQDDDKPLASAIGSSREAIWSLLANPTTFATLQS